MRTWLTSLSLIVLPVVLSPLTGCETECTDLAAASVTLELVDTETGDPVTGANVTYTVNGGDSQGAENHTDGTYVLGYEIEGSFVVQVTADGYELREEMYEVEKGDDGCHVEGAVDTIQLAREES